VHPFSLSLGFSSLCVARVDALPKIAGGGKGGAPFTTIGENILLILYRYRNHKVVLIIKSKKDLFFSAMSETEGKIKLYQHFKLKSTPFLCDSFSCRL
jgi:hypothetical protein